MNFSTPVNAQISQHSNTSTIFSTHQKVVTQQGDISTTHHNSSLKQVRNAPYGTKIKSLLASNQTNIMSSLQIKKQQLSSSDSQPLKSGKTTIDKKQDVPISEEFNGGKMAYIKLLESKVKQLMVNQDLLLKHIRHQEQEVQRLRKNNTEAQDQEPRPPYNADPLLIESQNDDTHSCFKSSVDPSSSVYDYLNLQENEITIENRIHSSMDQSCYYKNTYTQLSFEGTQIIETDAFEKPRKQICVDYNK